MRNVLLPMLFGVVAVAASGQGVLPIKHKSFPVQPTPDTLTFQPITIPTELPMWTYSVTAGPDLGGGTYTGTLIGRSPYLKLKTTTTIPLQIVPVKVIINNGGADSHTYDPTVNDGCVPAGHTAVDIVQNSPIFTNTPWTMDGVNVGTTQYHDAHMRASFWSLVAGTSYHLIENVTVLPEQTMYLGSVGNLGSTLGPGKNFNVPETFATGCGFMGVVNVDTLVTAVNSLLGSLSPEVNVGTLPMILVDSVVSSDTGDVLSGCCILGFHDGFNVGTNLQVTSIFDLDYNGLFGNEDVDTIAHELGEAIFDPTGNNLTPPWGSVGQEYGSCPSSGQNNLEVGDPLSEGSPPVANEHVVVPGTDSNVWVVAGTGPSTGLTYHLQELALFSWFFGGANLGIPGFYSNNGTFHGDAVLCSLGGGTN